MKGLVLVLFFTASVLAQNPSAPVPTACGPQNVIFKASVGNLLHTPTKPAPGKAQIYFIQDNGVIEDHQHYTLKIGLDGAWVGAFKSNSYFDVEVDPGEHHVCANVQSDSDFGSLVELAHFTAAPGRIYYFRTQFPAGVPGPAPPYVHLEQADSDEARYLIATYPLSVWTQK